jgi:hypothetical protein
MNTPTKPAPEPELVLATLIDVEADLAALERVVRRTMPSFESPTLANVRRLIVQIKGDEVAA